MALTPSPLHNDANFSLEMSAYILQVFGIDPFVKTARYK